MFLDRNPTWGGSSILALIKLYLYFIFIFITLVQNSPRDFSQPNQTSTAVLQQEKMFSWVSLSFCQTYIEVRGFYVMIKYNNMDDIKDLRWMVRWVQALLRGVGEAQVRLVQRVELVVVVLPLGVVGAGQVAAAPGAPGAPAAARGVTEAGDGARGSRPVVCEHELIWRKYEMNQ